MLYVILVLLLLLLIGNVILYRRLKDQNKALTESNKRVEQKLAELNSSINQLRVNLLLERDAPLPLSVSHQEKSDQDQNANNQEIYAKYDELQMSRPDYEEFFGRPNDYPRYTDQYDTGTGFSLRELLLLEWWGYYKNGRSITSSIPLYFYQQYHLNAPKVTKRFVDKGWLIKEDGRYQLSDETKKIVVKFKPLWQLHMETNFNFCLDEDFPKWNDGALLTSFYQKDIQYLTAQITYYQQLINFFKKYPKFFDDEVLQKKQLKSLADLIDKARGQMHRDEEKIETRVK